MRHPHITMSFTEFELKVMRELISIGAEQFVIDSNTYAAWHLLDNKLTDALKQWEAMNK